MSEHRRVIFEIPYHIAIPENIVFQPIIRNFPIGIMFETINKGKVKIGGNATVRRERFGNTSASKVTAIFHERFDEIFSDKVPDEGIYPGGRWFPDKDGFYIKFAVDALNEVMSSYRHVTGSYWIQKLYMGDIAQFKIENHSGGAVVDTTERQISRGSVQMGGDTERKIKQMHKVMSDSSNINFYQEIHLDIREKVDLGDYGLSVLLSYMLFERWVKNTFLLSISEIKTEKKANDLAFDNNDQFKPLMGIIDMFRDHADLDFKEFPEYDEWRSGLYELRNSVVHEFYQPTFEEAGDAHDLCINSIEWLQNELCDYIKNRQEDVNFSFMRDYHELDPMNMYKK